LFKGEEEIVFLTESESSHFGDFLTGVGESYHRVG